MAGFSIEEVKNSAKDLFKGKKKWYVIGGLSVALLLYFWVRSRQVTSSDQTVGQLTYSGYPEYPTDVGSGGGSGSGSGGVSSSDLANMGADFSKQLTDLTNSWQNALNQQQSQNDYQYNELLAQLQAQQAAGAAGTQQYNDLLSQLQGLQGQLAAQQSAAQAAAATQGAKNISSPLYMTHETSIAQSAADFAAAIPRTGSGASTANLPVVSYNDKGFNPSTTPMGEFIAVGASGAINTWYNDGVNKPFQTTSVETNRYNADLGQHYSAADQALIDKNRAIADATAQKIQQALAANGGRFTTPIIPSTPNTASSVKTGSAPATAGVSAPVVQGTVVAVNGKPVSQPVVSGTVVAVNGKKVG